MATVTVSVAAKVYLVPLGVSLLLIFVFHLLLGFMFSCTLNFVCFFEFFSSKSKTNPIKRKALFGVPSVVGVRALY